MKKDISVKEQVYRGIYNIMLISSDAANELVDLIGYNNYLKVLKWLGENYPKEFNYPWKRS